MKDDSDWYIEHVRRKALAEIKIANELGKQNPGHQKQKLPSDKQTHQRFQSSHNFAKSGFGMKMLGIMLTLVSVIVVTSCFITTVDSYNMALVDTNNPGPGINGGSVLNPFPSIVPRVAGFKLRQHLHLHVHQLKATLRGP